MRDEEVTKSSPSPETMKTVEPTNNYKEGYINSSTNQALIQSSMATQNGDYVSVSSGRKGPGLVSGVSDLWVDDRTDGPLKIQKIGNLRKPAVFFCDMNAAFNSRSNGFRQPCLSLKIQRDLFNFSIFVFEHAEPSSCLRRPFTREVVSVRFALSLFIFNFVIEMVMEILLSSVENSDVVIYLFRNLSVPHVNKWATLCY